MQYTVTWTINVDAEDAISAAVKAKESQGPDTEALFFEVTDDTTGETIDVVVDTGLKGG